MKIKIGIGEFRESYAIVMLGIFLFSIAGTFAPILSDLIAHTFNNAQHHSTLHISGVDHLHTEVIDLVHTTESNKAPGKIVDKVCFQIVFVNYYETDIISAIPESKNILFIDCREQKFQNFSAVLSPPPKASFLNIA